MVAAVSEQPMASMMLIVPIGFLQNHVTCHYMIKVSYNSHLIRAHGRNRYKDCEEKLHVIMKFSITFNSSPAP